MDSPRKVVLLEAGLMEKVCMKLRMGFASMVLLASTACGSLVMGQQVCPISGQVISTKAAAADKTIVETAIAADGLSTLVTAVKQGQLVETLSGKGPFTVFAPINSAFAKLPKETIDYLLKDENRAELQAILTYHVVPGRVMAADVVKLTEAKTAQGSKINIAVKDGKVYINDAQVITTDIECSNGVVHLIDSVILPPKQPTIVELAAGNEDFSTLVTLVKHAGLVDVLSSEGPFTVFAPNNAAFAKLPQETVDALLSDAGKEQLTAILKYHVVPGNVKAADVVKVKAAKTAQGQSVTVKVENGKVFIDGAQVIATDIECANGVIHVIDSVILPKSE
jgi:transforming growth factor-beta-induced protein